MGFAQSFWKPLGATLGMCESCRGARRNRVRKEEWGKEGSSYCHWRGLCVTSIAEIPASLAALQRVLQGVSEGGEARQVDKRVCAIPGAVFS